MSQFTEGVWLAILALFLLDHGVYCQCPDNDPTLRRWSSHSTWPGSKKPVLNQAVVIDSPVLFDESPPELHSITIQPNGRLVWSQEADYDLTLKYILVYGGMEIGSENCTYYRKTHIVLRGIRGQYQIRLGEHQFDEKFIGVAPGGTLELHGEKKLSWTKLTSTVFKLHSGTGLIYNHEDSAVSQSNGWKPGLAVYVFNEKTGKPESGEYFYLGGSEPTLSKKDPEKLIHLLDNVPANKIIALAVNKNMVHPAVDLRPIFTSLQKLGYSSDPNAYIGRYGDAFVLLAQKGNPSITQQTWGRNYNTDFQQASAVLSLPAVNLRFSVQSYIDNSDPDKSKVDFRVVQYKAAHPVLNLLDDVTTWAPGDRVVLASTDYDWKQAEEATIVLCSGCSANQVQIELDVHYTHFGEIDSKVDMRGEVALLTRNILIEGEMENNCQISNGNCQDFKYDTFGGHLKFVQGFKNGHIEGVELYHMGQQTEIGHYPVHFHLCHDVDDANYTKPPYFKDSTVHHSFSRCVTIHGSSGVLVSDNVCFDALGHSYFLEDGGEKRNVFDGNIGLTTRKGKILITDSRPATFWMTNPMNSLRNNVAAGSETYGIWYVFPDEPYGPSYGLGFVEKYQSLHTPYKEWQNNVAHSNGDTGFYVDNKIHSTTDASGPNGYSPRVRPLDPNSLPAQVDILRPTLYKNRRRNMMLRGGWFVVNHGSFSDSPIGATFAKSDDQQQFLWNSVILGESRNLGEPDKNTTGLPVPRSLPNPNDRETPINGFAFYDGPVYIEDIWFNGFTPNSLRKAGAIGFHRNNEQPSSAVSSVKTVYFPFGYASSGGQRIYEGDATVHGYGDMDGDRAATFRDSNGYLTGHSHAQIIRPTDFNMNQACYKYSYWNVAACPQVYGKLTVLKETQDGRGDTTPFAIRDDIPTIKETRSWKYPAQFLAILGGGYSYTIHWTNYVPHQFSVRGDGIELGKWVRFGVCLPRDAKFDLFSESPKFINGTNGWTSVTSIKELEADIVGDRYFWDAKVGLLFLKFINFQTKTAAIKTECPAAGCPHVRITLLSGNTLDADCTTRAYNIGPYNRTAPKETPYKYVTMKATSSPGALGAGSTRPFSTRTLLNGGLSGWSYWTDCHKNCNGTQSRYRWCNNPIPQNGGKHCTGATIQFRKCDPTKCVIDGGWSAYSDWGRCSVISGCHGFQKKYRTCDNPAPKNNGDFCNGSDEEVRPCDTC